MTDHIPDPGKMVPERCEPPEHLRGVDGWHWLTHPKWGEWPTRYSASCHAGVWPIWQCPDSNWTTPAAHREGWRYLAPVATPAEVEALRAERDAAIARDRNASAAHATRATDLWLVTEERDNLRAGTDRLIAERITLRARVAELEAILRECADELECEIRHNYAGTEAYPSQARRMARDMDVVNRAKNVLEGKNDG